MYRLFITYLVIQQFMNKLRNSIGNQNHINRLGVNELISLFEQIHFVTQHAFSVVVNLID